MNKVISVYELLGLIKDGKAPKKIIYDNKKYFIEVHDYSLNDERVFWLFEDSNIIEIMTKKVEIIEDYNTTIEKIKIEEDIVCNKFIRNEYGSSCYIKTHDRIIIEKLNEVIDYINRNKGK